MASNHLKTAFSSIRRSPFQALSAVFVLAITFFVSTILFAVVYSTNQVLTYFETRPQVIAFLVEDATDEQIKELSDELSSDTRIKDVVYVDKEEALAIYKGATVDNPLLAELVSPSIFPASLEFSLTDLSYAEAVIEQVEVQAIVEQVAFTASLGGDLTVKDTVTKLRNITTYIRIGGGAFVVVLLGTSFLVLMVIISMRVVTRREEVEILNLIGATTAFIRKPIVIESLIYSVSGVVLGWLFALILILYSAPTGFAYFSHIPVLPKDPVRLMSIFGIDLAVSLLIGVLLALAGSYIAVARAKKSK